VAGRRLWSTAKDHAAEVTQVEFQHNTAEIEVNFKF
jgi:hypothetical protein